MKKIYLVLFCAFAISTTSAQPGFTSADLPNIGDQDTVMYLNYYPITNDLDSETGNGYSWDFSTLPFSMYPNFIYTDTWRVKTHQVSIPFVDATIEEFINDGTAGDVNLFSFSNDTLYVHRLGAVVSGADFIPPMPAIVFPIAFNNSSVVKVIFHQGIYTTGERTTTFSYDGYGTLHMPGNKTYSNVLRVKKIEKDSSYIVPSSLTNTTYLWYKQGGQVPLLQLIYSGSLNLYFVKGSKANGTGSNGIANKHESNDFMISPNPSDGKFRLTGLNFHPDKTEIYNIMGEKVREYQDGRSLDLTDSPRGIYFVTVFKGGITSTRKLIIR
jgi:hypothetical protein